MCVKMTLRSAARPRQALARHSAGTCISSGTLQSHLCFTPITLVIHSFLFHSHFFHMLHNWLVRAWRLASTKHSLILWFSAKALPILVSLISFQCLSFPSVVSAQTFPCHFPGSKPTVWPMTEQRRPTLMPLPVILLPIFVSGKTIDYFLRVVHFFMQNFRCHIFSVPVSIQLHGW